MRKRFSPRPYLQILAVLLAFMSLSKERTETLQGVTVAFFAPSWTQLNYLKKVVAQKDDTQNEEIQRLQLENQLLANEAIKLQETLQKEHLLDKQLTDFLSEEELQNLEAMRLIHKKHIAALITTQIEAIPAEVLFRSPATWNNSLWINRGSSHNKSLGREIICKNSPVVIGTSVLGVVDYVGNKQSRVRLITDGGLSPSVRAIRKVGDNTVYLAKGELTGAAEPSWRKQSLKLKGVGFNYDFSDEEGPARDLRTGEIIGSRNKNEMMPIIQEGDLLITTGMDGTFPPGLQVATVSTIQMLKEGDYAYEIEASPTIKNLDNVSLVSILPPLRESGS